MDISAVILAAGRGSRLGIHTDSMPKCLVPVAGRPLIHYAFSSLADAGIRRVVVVTGYRQRQLAAALGDGGRFGLQIDLVSNPHFSRGNASSLAKSLSAVDGSFVLTMADHIISSDLLRTLMYAADGGNAIAIDKSVLTPERFDEATKVSTDRGLVTSVGKDLLAWDGVDTGVSFWSSQLLAECGEDQATGELAALMTRVAAIHPVQAADVTGSFWMDVDTAEDMREAEMALGAADAGLVV